MTEGRCQEQISQAAESGNFVGGEEEPGRAEVEGGIRSVVVSNGGRSDTRGVDGLGEKTPAQHPGQV